MNTITKVIIENFQAHKKTTVFPAAVGQLTVLTGPSDSGKTAVIRALRWALYNIPQGTDYIRAGTSTARVTVEYSSGHQVIRERTRSYNRYIVVDAVGERQTYEGFGNSVPLEVQLVTGVRPVVIADMEILVNLSEQLDGPFLGSKSVSAGTRAKALGKLAGTEEIDYAARQLGTDLYRRRQDEKGFNNVVVGLEEKIGAYDYLEEMGAWVEVAREILARLMADVELLERLEQLDADIHAVSKLARDRQQVAIELQVSLGEIEPLLNKVGQDSANEVRLNKLSIGLVESMDKLIHAQGVLDTTAGVCAAAKLIGQVEQAYGDRLRLSRLARNLGLGEEAIKQAKKVLRATKHCTAIDGLVEDTKRASDNLNRFNDLNGSLLGVKGRIIMANRILESTLGQLEAGQLLARVTQDMIALGQLQGLNGRYRDVRQGKARALVSLKETEYLDRLTALIQDTEGKLTLCWQLNKLHVHINDASRSIAESVDRISHFGAMAQEAQQQYIDLLTRLGVCPTCGAIVALEKLKEVV